MNHPALKLLRILVKDPQEARDRLKIAFEGHKPIPKSRGRDARYDDVADQPISRLESMANRTVKGDSHTKPTKPSDSGKVPLPARTNPGRDHDADPQLVAILQASIQLFQPRVIVETGVARGASTAAILANIEGTAARLYSFDLPPLREPWYSESCALVPQHLKRYWTYVRGDIRRTLPRQLAKIAPIDVFIHDSLHTYGHMSFEFGEAAKHMQSGILISDDIETNSAFAELMACPRTVDAFITPHTNKNGLIGVALIS